MTTKKFAVIGDPIDHSLSPIIHQLFAQQFNLDLEYEKTQVRLNELTQALSTFESSNIKGINVTAPLKQEAFRLSTQHSTNAKTTNTTNTLTRTANGWIADNTDGVGFIQDLTKNHQVTLQTKSILILGAGGAVKGILSEIIKQKPKHIVVANRTLATAEIIAKVKPALVKTTSIEKLNSLSPFDLIINGTSLGLMGKTIDIPKNIIHGNTIAYDLSYGEASQPFITTMQSLGVQHCYDGLGMLVEQAAESFFIWHQQRPSTKMVIKKLKEEL